MQYSEVKTLLKGRLARFSASTSLDSYINAELNAAMEDLEGEGFIPWFLWTTTTGLTSSITGDYQLDLPSDFARELLDDSEDPDGSNFRILGSDLFYTSLDRMNMSPIKSMTIKATDTDRDVPTAYYVNDLTDKIEFDTYCIAEFFWQLDYVKVGDRYTSSPEDTEEPLWAKHAPNYLIAQTGFRIATTYIKNRDAAGFFGAELQRERAKLITKHTARLESKISPNKVN